VDTLVLYEHPLSPYAQKCKIALREKQVPFEARLPEGLGTGALRASGFRKVSPRMEVPALVDGGFEIFDSTIILEYIEERWPEPALLPATPRERARVRMIEDVMDTHYEAINWGLGEVRFFHRGKGTVAETLWEGAGTQLGKWFRYLEDQLGDRDWFNGDAFGWADLCVVPYLNGSRGFGFKPEPRSPLHRWLERVHERPSVTTTAEEATASIAGMEGVAEWVERGLMKREYRDHRLEWMIRSGGLPVVLEGIERENIRFLEDFEPPT